MAKIIKSVTLVPGEKFTLPPGSTLIGSSNTADLTSNCDIPTLEEVECFVAVFGSNVDNGTSGAAFYEGDFSYLLGYRLNGTVTNFATPYQAGDATGLFELDDIGTELKTLLPAIIATDEWGVSDSDRGGLNILLIQTIASVAENLQLIYNTSAALDDPSVDYAAVTTYIEFITRDAAVALNYNDIPDCPSDAPAP